VLTKLAGKMVADMDHGGDGGAPRRTRLSAAERRETILRAAAGVFAEAGYRAAKVSDVAERVGVTEPVIFQNFGSKAALFAAVVERAAAEIRASLDDLAAGFGSASGLLAHVLTGSAHGGPAHSATGPGAGQAGTGHAGAGHAGGEPAGGEPVAGAYGVLFADAAALTADPALGEPARGAVRAVAAHLADLIRRAQADGDIRPDTDPEAAAWLLLSVLSARRLRAAAMPAGLEPAVTALALQALVPPPDLRPVARAV
jgi:AcrR family transcriptional regulator